MERGPDPITHLALGKYARVATGPRPRATRSLWAPNSPIGCCLFGLSLRSDSWSVAGSGWPGYSTAFRAAELAAEKFSSWLVWYSFHAAESQISRWSKLPNTTHSFVSPA